VKSTADGAGGADWSRRGWAVAYEWTVFGTTTAVVVALVTLLADA
jgi:hypothetical protein